MIKKILTLALAAVVLMMIGSCSKNDASSKQSDPATRAHDAVATQQTAGGVQYTAYDIDGKLRNLSDWIGKQPVIVNFWGTWCPPCRREIPDLVKLYNEYHPKGIEILGLAVKDDPSDVRRFSEKAGMNWVMMMANNDLATAFKLPDAVPTTIFFDRTGKEISRLIGGQTYDQFKPHFESIL